MENGQDGETILRARRNRVPLTSYDSAERESGELGPNSGWIFNGACMNSSAVFQFLNASFNPERTGSCN